ncbi:MAG TPA: 1-deoxy-D-xylulose-5-phosphate reductoisomerase, partial [Actinomycetota bacterium]|nr:1-deoxy-D-xylulose-5-phosphate reductoisomerase [Actinomycetota bacterium]
PAVLNAANEEAVGAFLDGRIAFTAIAETVERVLDQAAQAEVGVGEQGIELADVLRADAWARLRAREQ